MQAGHLLNLDVQPAGHDRGDGAAQEWASLQDMSQNYMMFGAESGLGPFMGFLEERGQDSLKEHKQELVMWLVNQLASRYVLGI